MFTRREFIKVSLYGALYLSCRDAFEKAPLFLPLDADPIAVFSDVDATEFAGDAYDRPHDLIRFGKAKGLKAETTETIDLVVVGGGMAGLCAAYFLREHDPLVLEQAPLFGGNSKGEEWRGMPYSIGAAYITKFDPNSEIEGFLKDLDLLKHGRSEEGRDGATVLDGSRLVRRFWQGGTDPERSAEFEGVLKRLAEIYERAYPSIPYDADGLLTEAEWKSLDRIDFASWVKKEFPSLHPHIAEFLVQYCWSSFGGGPAEISAAQALNFLSSDLQGTMAFPGGNAAITSALYRALREKRGTSRLRSGCVVTEIALRGDGVEISYSDDKGKMRSVRAKACVAAIPKFVAKHIMPDLLEEQRAAMNRLRYRSYLVANVLIRGKLESASYELFRLARRVPTDNTQDLLSRPFTDLIFGNWARKDAGGNSVLTLYKAYPFDGARHMLIDPGFYAKARADFEKGLPEITSALGLDPARIAGLRLSRWGHALPLSEPGLMADGIVEKASSPIGGRIFFAEQDNWANPAFETSYGEAKRVAEEIKKII